MPLIVPGTCVAPASTAASVLATAQPESSCVWMPSATSPSASRTTANAVRTAGVGGAVAPPRHPEGDQLGALKALAGEQLEQLLLLRVRRGKASLDERDPQRVERVHDAQPLLRREAQTSAAHAVAQGGVV